MLSAADDYLSDDSTVRPVVGEVDPEPIPGDILKLGTAHAPRGKAMQARKKKEMEKANRDMATLGHDSASSLTAKNVLALEGQPGAVTPNQVCRVHPCIFSHSTLAKCFSFPSSLERFGRAISSMSFTTLTHDTLSRMVVYRKGARRQDRALCRSERSQTRYLHQSCIRFLSIPRLEACR
jgi:hypothetical protein